jgi:hypothetical protein
MVPAAIALNIRDAPVVAATLWHTGRAKEDKATNDVGEVEREMSLQ